jgi:hypothetical protein
MNIQLTKIILSTLAALTIVACSGSGVGIVAGIGGSGFISSGTISGFGSVFVNGVEYETDSATFDVDGDPDGTEDDLAIGMVVQVTGTINDDGITGTATNISFDEELQGPVSSLSAPDADGITRSFTILGATVIIDSSSTTFDIDSDNVSIPADTIFDFDTINLINSVPNVNNVEISGFFNQAGYLVATRVELKDIDFDTSSIVEVKGTIIGTGSTTFGLEGLTLTIDASSATLDDLPNGLEHGQLVEVKGTFNTVSETITATKVEGEDNLVDDTDEFELEGIITDYDFVGDTNFKIGGITVDARNIDAASLSILENDLRVEAEGAIEEGILFADEIELEGGDIKIHAMVTAVPPITASNTFEVSPVLGQAITVIVTIDTQLEDETGEHGQFTFDSLNDTHFVEVRGYDDGSGKIIATEVDIKEPSDIVLQGYATAATGNAISGGEITILNVVFKFDGLTDFENENDQDLNNIQINALISAISSEPQLIKIEDKLAQDEVNPAGTADEVDIE